MTGPFIYSCAIENIGLAGSHAAVVPGGVSDRDRLFGRLARALRLPDYFGLNWDALDECLRDLSWIEEHRVVLFHEALPELGDEGLTAYLEILRDAVLDWRRGEDGELVVSFPPEAVGRVTGLLEP